MGIDFLDLVFRLEKAFGTRLSRREIEGLIEKSGHRDIKAGDLFDYVRRKARLAGSSLLDDQTDAELMWALFQHAVSDSMGVDPHEVTKDKWIFHELDSE